MLKNGRKASLNAYAQAKAEYDDLYANADANTRAKIDGLMMSSQNYSSANPMNNRSTREYQTRMYQNASAIMRGENTPSPGAVVSTPNLFNGYSSVENQNNADTVTSRYMSHAGTSNRSGATTTTTTTATPSGSYYKYNWAQGFSKDWAFDDENIEDRMNALAEVLQTNLGNALAAKQSGKRIVGIDENNIEAALGLLNGRTWTKDNFKEFAKIARLAGVNASVFKSYFGNLLPGADQISKNKQKLVDAGYQIVDNIDFGNNKIRDRIKDYKIAKKGNDYYLINSDYSGPVTGAASAYIDTDWRGGNEGMGYAIDADGRFVFGDMNPYYTDTNSPWYKQLSAYLNQYNAGDYWHGNKVKYNQYTSLSDSDLINHFASNLHSKNIADVSRYFDGKDVVITAKDNNIDAYKTAYGHLRLNDPNLTFYYRTKDGEYKTGSYQEALADLGDITLNSTKAGKGLQNYQSADLNLDTLVGPTQDIVRDLDINGESEWHNWWSPHRKLKNEWNGEVLNSDHSMTGNGNGIQNTPGQFARLMLYAYYNEQELSKRDDKDSKELMQTLNNWMSSNDRKRDLISIIYNDMKSYPQNYTDPRYREAFQMLISSSKGLYSSGQRTTEVIQQEKQGGILKAKMGTGLDVNGNPIPEDKKEGIAAGMRDKANKLTASRNALQQRAAENGRDVNTQYAIDQNEWTSSDTLRATALATDIVGLIGAITGAATGGVGSAVAVGSGFLSMAQDAIADFTDDKVSTGEAWKNVAVNTGLAAGAFLGAKAPKIIKSTLKLVPKAMMIAAGAGVTFDPNVHNTISRISEGKSMNVEDWRNILLVLRTATGIGTVGATEHGSKKALKRFDKAVAEEMKAQGLDGKQTTVGQGSEKTSIKSETAKEVESLLKSGKETEAKQKISEELGITEDQAAKYLEEIPGARKWYKPWERKDSPGKRLITDDIEGEAKALPDDVMADVYDNALAQSNSKFAQAQQKHRLMNWADKATQRMSFGLIKQQNYGANALMARAGVNNAKDLNNWIEERESPTAAFDKANIDSKAIVAQADAERQAVRRTLANRDKNLAAVNKKFDVQRDQASKAEQALQAQGFVKDDVGRWHLNGKAGHAVSEAHTNMSAAEKAAIESQKKYDLAELRARQLRNNLNPKDLKTYTDLQSKATNRKVTLAKAVSAEQDFLKAHPELQMPTSNGTFKANSAAEADPRYKMLVKDVQKAQKDMDATTSALETLFKKKGNKKIGQELQLFEEDLRNATTENKSAQKRASKARAKFDAAKAQHDKEMSRLEAARKNWKAKGIDIDDMDVETKRSDAIDQHNKSYEKNLNSRMEQYKSAHDKAMFYQAQDIGYTRKDVKVTTTNGSTETIWKGAKVESYQHLRNVEGAKRIYKDTYPNAVELTKEQAMKLVNTKNKGDVRGGFYDPITNKVMIYQQGGKYSNLRK